jgi:SpoVK/Ycf46/Vps4 family AAA+-type ATPase
MARAIAGEVDAAFFQITPSEIMQKYVGESEKAIHDLFAKARQHERAVIFFDEIEGLASTRQKSEDYMRRAVNQLLTEIQGFESYDSSLLVIGATNNPQLIDHAMLRPGRLDELIYVPLPDREARERLWQLKLEEFPERLGEFDYENLAGISEGYSGAEIEYLCQKGRQLAADRWKHEDEDALIEMADLETAIDLIRPRTTEADLDELQAFARLYDRNFADGAPSDAIGPNAAMETPVLPRTFTLHPEGLDLEDTLESLLAPFPCEPNLLLGLAGVFKGRHIQEIIASIALAVRECFGNVAEPLPDELKLALAHFISMRETRGPRRIDLPGEAEAPATERATSGVFAGVPGSGMTGTGPEDGREILAAGMDVIERFDESLSTRLKTRLTDRLYELADLAAQSGMTVDLVAYEAEVLLALKEEDDAGEEIATEAPGRPDETPAAADQRRRAMEILGHYRGQLDIEDLRGLGEEVVHSRVIDPESFRGRVQALAGQRVRDRQERTARELFTDRREFLDPGEIRKIEAALADPKADYRSLIEMIQQQTYRRKLEQVVKEAAREMDLPKKLSYRLQRKAIRAMEKSGEMPTAPSVRSRMKYLRQELENWEQQSSEGSSEQPATVDDVRDLILPPLPLDFSDVAGMRELKEEMEFAVEVPINPEKRAFYTRVTGEPPENAAMLLYGTPGCGKTFLARAAAMEFAHRYGFKVIMVPMRAIDGLHYTKKCPRVVELFNLAKKEAPAIVIWDEFDGIASPPMFSNRKYNATICAELKSQFEGVAQSGELVVHIATSNYPWDLEPALMRQGRLGRLIHVKPPDDEARREIIEMMLSGADLAGDVDFAELTGLTDGMTIAEINKALLAGKKETVRLGLAGNGDDPALVGSPVLVNSIAANPAAEYRTWLALARRHLNMPRYECQREFFKGLLVDVESGLNG